MNQSLSSWLISLGLLISICALSSSCDHSTPSCMDDGTCECISEQQCPDGEHCVNGHCRKVTSPHIPQKFFAEPCLSDEQCFSGLCLPEGPGNGGVCTIECDEQACPEGWECKTRLDDSGASQELCVQRINSRLCQSCSVSSQCNAIGDLCTELSGDFFCTLDCTNSTCPDKYTCTEIAVEKGTVHQCVPEGVSCTCTTRTLGLTRACEVSNEFGLCLGQQQCVNISTSAEWGSCDAPTPSAEICNGMDDDCDGLTDDEDPSINTDGLPDDPPYPNCKKGSEQSNCIGRWHCQPDPAQGWAWVCGATDPENETCNGLDDNCDGIADDPFIDDMGRYITTDNCGACGTNCLNLLEHLRRDSSGEILPGAAVCQIRDDAPTCVPIQCEPGYYPFPENKPSACAPLVSPSCQPCSNDADCRISSDRCIALPGEPGGFCAQSCAPSAPYFGCTGTIGQQDCCLPGYTCSLNQGAYLCMPDSGSCTCDQDRVGQSRTCLIDGAGGQLCQGKQSCEESAGDYAWGLCEQSDVVVEVCDYLDNDCDGQVDEDFINESGDYFTDENCGACNVNCLARWDRDIQHAIGGCLPYGGNYECQIVACTTETKPSGMSCRCDDDCGSDEHCDQQLWMCTPDDPDQCGNATCSAPCSSDSDCLDVYGAGSACNVQTNHCETVFQFQNPNGLDIDGCECAQIRNGPPDEPDVSSAYPTPGMNYRDTDCDGIDGHAADSIFVWSGSEDSRGTRDAPYKTIAEALNSFDPASNSAILVASGIYHENLALPAGAKLYGGYHPDFSSRDVILFPSMITGTQVSDDPADAFGTINAISIHTKTVLSGFVIQGYDVTTRPEPGQNAVSSYAVYVKDCDSSLEISNNWILGGKGGSGSDGLPGDSGQNGDNGFDGNQSMECSDSADCLGRENHGGRGGRNHACPSADGRPGADARGTQFDPQDYQGGSLDGRGGYNSTYINDGIDSSLCKYDCQVGIDTSNNGMDALSGQTGGSGSPGEGCHSAIGSIVDGRWLPAAASPGGAGRAGQGGGGGGAGGAVYNENFNNNPPCEVGEPWGDLGGSGGGGGAGGCGGQGGQAGGGGGGSFGVFLVFSSSPASMPRIFGNLIRRGLGGSGGDGGSAAQGGLGGQGGFGGNIAWPAWCAGTGGRGGRGGDGGAGGGGGGGCGGASYAIAGQHLSQAEYEADNAFSTPGTDYSGGPGGHGGPSPAGNQASGSDGQRGLSGDLGSF